MSCSLTTSLVHRPGFLNQANVEITVTDCVPGSTELVADEILQLEARDESIRRCWSSLICTWAVDVTDHLEVKRRFDIDVRDHLYSYVNR